MKERNRGKNGITACPCPFFHDCLSFLGFGYGRFRNFDTQFITQRFYTFRLVLCVCLGLWAWLSPLPLLGEFESDDSVNLRDLKNDVNTIMTTNEHIYDLVRGALLTYGGDINTVGWTLNLMQDDVDVIRDQSVELFNVLGYGSYSSRSGSLKQSLNTLINYLGYGSGSSQSSALTSIVNQTNQIKSALGGDLYNTIADRLDDIINALNNSPTLPTDYATESTLSSFKSKYEDISSQFLTSWGFVGGSNGTFNDLITPFYSSFGQSKPYTYTNFIFAKYLSGTNSTPFPITVPSNSLYYWFSDNYTESVATKNFSSPFEFLAWSNGFTLSKYFTRVQSIAKKQSWNDWYAHTNIVAQIVAQVDRIVLPPENGRQDSTFDPETGEIITPSSSGGSSGDEVVGIKPVYTNDFAVIEQDSTTVTNAFDFVQQKKIKDRYISDNMLDVGTYHDYGNTGGKFSGVIQFDTFKIDFAEHYDQYRMIVSIKNLDMLRNAMQWIWRFLACISAFWFVLKIANLNSSEGGE